MNYVIAILIAGTVYLMIDFGLEKQYERGYLAGHKAALITDPVSEDLEIVCASLWVGQQNKKVWEKENARKH